MVSLEKGDFFEAEIEEEIKPVEELPEPEEEPINVLLSFSESFEEPSPNVLRRQTKRNRRGLRNDYHASGNFDMSFIDGYLKIKELEEQVTKMENLILEVKAMKMEKGSVHVTELENIAQSAKVQVAELSNLFGDSSD